MSNQNIYIRTYSLYDAVRKFEPFRQNCRKEKTKKMNWKLKKIKRLFELSQFLFNAFIASRLETLQDIKNFLTVFHSFCFFFHSFCFVFSFILFSRQKRTKKVSALFRGFGRRRQTKLKRINSELKTQNLVRTGRIIADQKYTFHY